VREVSTIQYMVTASWIRVQCGRAARLVAEKVSLSRGLQVRLESLYWCISLRPWRHGDDPGYFQ